WRRSPPTRAPRRSTRSASARRSPGSPRSAERPPGYAPGARTPPTPHNGGVRGRGAMEHGTKRFTMTRARRVLNAVLGGAIAYGLGTRDLHLLTTRGARTGFLRTVPVSLVENTDGRFLVAPYGEVGWVRNIRKDGYATLRRGGWIELVSVVEVGPERAAPVL